MEKLRRGSGKVSKRSKLRVRKPRKSEETKKKIWELVKEIGVTTATVVLTTFLNVLKEKSTKKKGKKGK